MNDAERERLIAINKSREDAVAKKATAPVDWITVPREALRRALGSETGALEGISTSNPYIRLAVMTDADGQYFLAIAPDEFGSHWHLIPSK